MTIAQRTPITLHTPAEFRRHLFQFMALATGLLCSFLGLGVLGYHGIVGLDWTDSLLNASMILSGMGPVDPMPTDQAKVFASGFAILSGAVYPALAALVLYPIIHRMLKILHVQAISSLTDPGGDNA